jgi:hypothetical protein
MSAPAREMLGWLRRVEDRRLVRVADVRPEYAASVPDKDRLGRREGHWFGGLTYATLAAQIGVGCKKVPGDFWSLDITDDGYPCAMVACPCGSTPAVEPFGPQMPCGGCERYFFYDGENVWAYNSPTPVAEVPEPQL